MEIGLRTYKYTLLLLGFSLIVFSFSCKKQETNPQLEKVATFNLTILEPSGLSFGRNNETLLIASDKTNRIFETNLEGVILNVLKFNGEDIEGVTYNGDLDKVFIIEEQKREIIQLDYDGKYEETFSIAKPPNSGINGLEGITYNNKNKTFHLLNEDNPGLLYSWTLENGVSEEIEIGFADDFSAIFDDAVNSILWIVSDKDKMLFKCDYNGYVIAKFQLDKYKYEGIVVNQTDNLIYLVNDNSSELAIFKY
jgi:uncharacterized protein YjiK